MDKIENDKKEMIRKHEEDKMAMISAHIDDMDRRE